MKSLICTFIKNNHDWYNLLSAEPYCLKIGKDGDYYIFNYNMIESDFSNPIVCEARGIIIKISDNDIYPVCVSFNKFFNYGEQYAADIDWESAKVLEKMDGSMIRVWYDSGAWHVSTSGKINAKDAPLANGRTFYDLFLDALANNENIQTFDKFTNDLFPLLTYVFELVSPENKIVVAYEKAEIYYLTSFLAGDMEEVTWLGYPKFIKKPKEYSLNNIDDCIEIVNNFDIKHEGFVVSDKFGKRIKIKSPVYLATHKLWNNGPCTYKKIVEMMVAGIIDDYMGIYPEYKNMYDVVQNKVATEISKLENIQTVMAKKWPNGVQKKEYAEYINKEDIIKPLAFLIYDGKITFNKCSTQCKRWLFDRQPDKIIEILGLKEG